VVFGLVTLTGVWLWSLLILQSVEYALYSVGAVALCVLTIVIVLEPELRGQHY
jgi:bacteriorhodopsin